MWSAVLPKATIKLFIAVLVSLTLLPGNIGASDNPRVRRILIINEAGTTWPGINLIDQGIRAALETAPYELEFYREYMDTLLFPDPADQQRFREFYIRKYRDRRPDVIITVGPSPLKFMVEAQATAFPGVPIVFSYPNWVPGSPGLDSDFTGVENDLAAFDTIETALRLQPGTKHIVVAGGTSFNDTQFIGVVKAQLKPFESNFDVTYLTSLTMPDLLVRLKNIPKQSIVLITALTRDAAGSSFTAAKSSAMVAEAANAPVFSLVDATFGHGEVGGKISSLREQGRIAGELALRILKGEKPQDVPRVKSGTIYTFDWRALQRWGFKQSNLPPGSIVLNREPTLWERGRNYFLTGIAVIFLQAISILALLWHRARKRKAEAELATSEEKFSKTFRQSPLVLAISRTNDSRFIEVNESFEQQLGWKRDEVIGRTAHDLHLWADAEQRAEFSSQTQNKGSVRDLEAFIRRKDGEIRTFLVSAEVLEVSGHKCTLSVSADITERKQAEEMLSTMTRRLIEAQEEERAWIARELHDDFNQRIALVSVSLETLEGFSGSEAEAKSYTKEIKEKVIELGSDIHALSHRLHSSKLDYLGLAAACQGFCTELSARQNVEIKFHSENIPKGLSKEVSLCLFRVLQEALQNAVKYSGVRNFQVVLKRASGDIELNVSDSGSGFDPDEAISGQGLGLTSMKERLKLVDGQLSIESKPGHGTTIHARVPLSPETAAAKASS